MKNKPLPTCLQGNYGDSLGEFSSTSYGVVGAERVNVGSLPVFITARVDNEPCSIRDRPVSSPWHVDTLERTNVSEGTRTCQTSLTCRRYIQAPLVLRGRPLDFRGGVVVRAGGEGGKYFSQLIYKAHVHTQLGIFENGDSFLRI